MTGKELYDNYTRKNDEYASVVKLLPMACGSMECAFKILERCEQENKKLVVLYGEEQNDDSMEFIGEVMDGSLFIS